MIMNRGDKPSKDKLLVLSVIPGDLYLSDDHQVWRREMGVVRKGEECDMCGEYIDSPKFSGDYIGDDTKVHWECVEVLVPIQLFASLEDADNLRDERNAVRPTEDLPCQICDMMGEAHVLAVVMRAAYPYRYSVSPSLTAYIPMCQDCADSADLHPDYADIAITPGGEW